MATTREGSCLLRQTLVCVYFSFRGYASPSRPCMARGRSREGSLPYPENYLSIIEGDTLTRFHELSPSGNMTAQRANAPSARSARSAALTTSRERNVPRTSRPADVISADKILLLVEKRRGELRTSSSPLLCVGVVRQRRRGDRQGLPIRDRRDNRVVGTSN